MVDKPKIIETQRFEDFRGWMSVSAEGFHVVQINQGFSKKAGTLRGLHFQKGEHAQAKLVSCLHGSILTLEENTLMQWCVDNDFCAEAAKAVRYDSDFAWQTEPWPEGEYIVSEKDRNAEKFLFAIAKTK